MANQVSRSYIKQCFKQEKVQLPTETLDMIVNLLKRKVKGKVINDSMTNVNWHDHVEDGDQIIIYMYNPTIKDIFLKPIAEIASIIGDGKLVLIYTNPSFELKQEQNLNFISKSKTNKVNIYEVNITNFKD